MATQENKNGSERLPVAVIFGGEGAEHEISCLSAECVVSALEESEREYISIFIDKRGYWFHIPCGAQSIRRIDESRMKPTYPVKLAGAGAGFLCGGGIIRVSAAIPVLHGDLGEDGAVQGALRCAGISYVGSDTTAGALVMDKAYTKLLAEYMGIPTVPWFLYIAGASLSGGGKIAVNEDEAREYALRLGYPLFVKPARAGSSIGARPVAEAEELIPALRYASSVSERVLVEKRITEPLELECGYFDDGNALFTSPGAVANTDGFYSFSRKYCGKGDVKTLTRADVGCEINEKLRKYSELLCLVTGVRHIARIDYFLAENKLWFNEINSFPGMTEDSLYPKMLAKAGLPLSQALDRLLSGI